MKKKLSPIVLFSAIILFCVLMVVGNTLFQPSAQNQKEYSYLNLVAEVTAMIRSDYVQVVKPEEKFPGAFSAMVASLDPVSAYFNPVQTRLYKLYLQEKTCEIGVYGAKVEDYYKVTDVLENSPAAAAGLKAGDFIKAVNQKSIYGQSFWEMKMAVLSALPTLFEVVVLPGNTAKPITLKIKTQLIEDTSPILQNVRENILLFQLQRINQDTVEKVKNKLHSLTTPTNTRLILDLRKYRIGDLESLVQLAHLLFPREITLNLSYKDKKNTLTLGSKANKTYPTVVIVNQSTILYGELFALLYKYANPSITIIGSPTLGLFSQLKHIPLDDGSSLLLTVADFQWENHKNKESHVNPGITPDIPVKDTDFKNIIEQCITQLNTQTP